MRTREKNGPVSEPNGWPYPQSRDPNLRPYFHQQLSLARGVAVHPEVQRHSEYSRKSALLAAIEIMELQLRRHATRMQCEN
jgi:hypothetical protein